MQEVSVLGVGLHRFGKTGDAIVANKSVTELCRHAIDAALADAGVQWKQIQAVCAASSRFSGGKGWGLNGNDVVEDLGSTGIPVYNMSAGCAAGRGQRAFCTSQNWAGSLPTSFWSLGRSCWWACWPRRLGPTGGAG